MRIESQGATRTVVGRADAEAGGVSFDQLFESKLRAILETITKRLEEERQTKDLTEYVSFLWAISQRIK